MRRLNIFLFISFISFSCMAQQKLLSSWDAEASLLGGITEDISGVENQTDLFSNVLFTGHVGALFASRFYLDEHAFVQAGCRVMSYWLANNDGYQKTSPFKWRIGLWNLSVPLMLGYGFRSHNGSTFASLYAGINCGYLWPGLIQESMSGQNHYVAIRLASKYRRKNAFLMEL